MLLYHELVGSLRCGMTEHKVRWHWAGEGVNTCKQACARCAQQGLAAELEGQGIRGPFDELKQRATASLPPCWLTCIVSPKNWIGRVYLYPTCLAPVGFPSAPVVLFLFPASASHSLGLFCPSTGRKARATDRTDWRKPWSPDLCGENSSKGLAHTVLFSPKLAKTPKNVDMKPWGGLRKGDQYQHLPALPGAETPQILGPVRWWFLQDPHPLRLMRLPISALRSLLCAVLVVFVLGFFQLLCPRQVATHTKALHHKPPTLLLPWIPLVCKGSWGLDSSSSNGKSKINTSHDLVLALLSLPTTW